MGEGLHGGKPNALCKLASRRVFLQHNAGAVTKCLRCFVQNCSGNSLEKGGLFPFFLKVVGCLCIIFFLIITVSENFKTYRAPRPCLRAYRAPHELVCSCSKTSSYFGGGQLLLPTKHCMKPQLVKALVIKNNWKV